MLEFINKIDTSIVLWLNGKHTPFWDEVMWFASGKFSWIPLYLILIVLIIYKFRNQALPMILLVAVLISMSDFIASGIFKPLVERLRPSHEPSLKDQLHYVNNYRGGPFGFMSSHAANVFSLAFYFSIIAYRKIKWLPYVLIPWAFFVSISRIYLGVHYPTDILAPMLLSITIAFITAYICRLILIKYYNLK